MEEKPNIFLNEDTGEMSKWKGQSQNEVDQCWKNLAERMEEEVLDKYKVEVWKREAFIGRGAPLEWRRVRKNKKHIERMWCEDCWARNFSLSGEFYLQRLQSRQDELARRRR